MTRRRRRCTEAYPSGLGYVEIRRYPFVLPLLVACATKTPGAQHVAPSALYDWRVARLDMLHERVKTWGRG